jgi:hypothetical protein
MINSILFVLGLTYNDSNFQIFPDGLVTIGKEKYVATYLEVYRRSDVGLMYELKTNKGIISIHRDGYSIRSGMKYHYVQRKYKNNFFQFF